VPDEFQPERPGGQPQLWLRYSHLGLQFALTVGIFTYAGIWADGRFGTSPLFVLLGVGVGFGMGFYHLYRGVYPPRRGDSGSRS
jgi:hypothetical protein